MHSRILLVVLGTIVGISSLGSFAEPVADANQLRPRVLIVFKNGLSWIEHRGEVALSNGWGSIPTAPEAALGTVSLTSDEAKVDEIRTAGRSQSAVRGGATLDAILANSAGKMVTLRVGDREVSGKLLPIGMAPEIVLVESGGKTTAIPRNLITGATFDGEVPPADDRVTPSLRFHVAQRSASAPVRLSYVRSGIGWFPDYSITLDGNGRAALTMRATLVDDGEDLRDTDVFFAVGVPNFAFGHVRSPLSAGQSLAELFRALGQGASEAFSAMSNTMNVMLNTSQGPISRADRTSGFDAMTTEAASARRTSSTIRAKASRSTKERAPPSRCSKPR